MHERPDHAPPLEFVAPTCVVFVTVAGAVRGIGSTGDHALVDLGFRAAITYNWP